jgi:anti-anti-sigma regulatory factor
MTAGRIEAGACVDGPNDIPPSVRVRQGLGAARRPTTVIQLVGDHDHSSRGLLVAALEPIAGHLIVDLSNCEFIDTSVVGALIGKALALGKAGHRLELVVPRTAPFARTLDRLQIGKLLPVLDELPEVTGDGVRSRKDDGG